MAQVAWNCSAQIPRRRYRAGESEIGGRRDSPPENEDVEFSPRDCQERASCGPQSVGVILEPHRLPPGLRRYQIHSLNRPGVGRLGPEVAAAENVESQWPIPQEAAMARSSLSGGQ